MCAKYAGTMSEHTKVIVPGSLRALTQLVHDAAAEALAAPLFAHDQRSNFGERVAERRQLAAGDDGSTGVDADDKAVDMGRQFAQLAGQKVPGLLILLNQIVNTSGVALDGGP